MALCFAYTEKAGKFKSIIDNQIICIHLYRLSLFLPIVFILYRQLILKIVSWNT